MHADLLPESTSEPALLGPDDSENMIPSAPASSRRGIGLLCLPYEIRLNIYRFCIPTGIIFQIQPILCQWRLVCTVCWPKRHSNFPAFREGGRPNPRWLDDEFQHPCPTSSREPWKSLDDVHETLGRSPHSVLPSLLLVCRQISDEVLDVLYGENGFKVKPERDDERFMTMIFSEATRKRIRHMMLLLEPHDNLYYHKSLDRRLWDICLPRLRTLWVVAEEPINYSGISGHIWDRQKLWFNWLPPIVEYISENLSARATVLLDLKAKDKEASRTAKLLRQSLPQSDYRYVQTKVGDVEFHRKD